MTDGFSQNLAYVIGINDYVGGIPVLRSAVNDVARLAEILSDEQRIDCYKVNLSVKAEETTFQALNQLLCQTLPKDIGADDRVLFYFAGHGVAQDGDDGPEG